MFKITKIVVVMLLLSTTQLFGQAKMYQTNCFEFLFQEADVMKDGKSLDQDVRFTIWLNYTQQSHLDFNKNVGIYSGLSIRNVGFITNNEKIKEFTDSDGKLETETTIDKIKRRVYTLGVPLALKLGSFDNNFYFYGGGEIEYAFVYKEKRFEDDIKSKKVSWFSSEYNHFLPSVFAGIQLPGGLNLQYKMYLEDLLNTNYGKDTKYDQSGFTKSAMQYVSISFNFGKNDWKKYGAYVSEDNAKSL